MADSNLANAVTRATGKATNDAQLMNLARANMPEATRAELPAYQKGQSFVPYGQTFKPAACSLRKSAKYINA